ncbi:MAG: hypothetical protein ABI217_04780, partial [Chthoniobacterales bacterium]
MSTLTKKLICACTVLLTAASLSPAQEFRIAAAEPVKITASVPAASSAADTTRSPEPAPLTLVQAAPAAPQPAAP